MRYRDDLGMHDWSGALEGPSLEVTLPGKGKVQWLLPNTESLGYYRWSVPPADLERLVAASAADLSPRERIGLLGNLRALLDAGRLSGDRYLAAIGSLLADPEPTVQRTAVGALEVAAFDLVPPAAQDAYAAFLREKAGVSAALGKFPWDRLNPNGGSVAIGHPFGATGARILSQAVKELAAMPKGSRAIVSICADGGQGTVALLEAA